VLARIAREFRDALISGCGLPSLMSPTVVLRDLSCGVRVAGQEVVAAYLHRTAGRLPYGVGARETNIAGGPDGGAWEWSAGPAWADTVGAGVTAVRLGPGDRIAELTIAWDASRLDERSLRALPGPGGCS
jgi:hypothetical protein